MAKGFQMTQRYFLPFLTLPLLLGACTPTVEVKAPDKPIEINMNINIEHHIKVEIEKDLQQSIKQNPGIF